MGDDWTTPKRRVTVAEAARILDTTGEAVRSRIKRGTLASVKDGKTVYVVLDADQIPTNYQPDSAKTADQPQFDSTALISAKDETIATLREQLEAERQGHAETRRLLLEALTKIPAAIEAPAEARESDVSPGPTPTPTDAGEGLQTARETSFTQEEEPQRRGFWSRLFGG